MSRFLFSIDGGPETEVNAPLPYTIASTAAQSVKVTPLGQPVTAQGTISGNVLNVSYDPSKPGTEMQANTNTAGTLRYVLSTSMTPPSYAQITAGTGFYAAGTVATVEGSQGFPLPATSGADDLFFHGFVDGASADTNIATARVYIGTNSAFATIGSTTGNPTINNYTDADGVNWRYYEWTQAGGFTVTAGGGVEYELIAGGGGGGGGGAYQVGGGGGAGGRLIGTSSLTPATYAVTVGAGGTGRTSTAQATNGGDSTALNLTAIGGGAGGTSSGNAENEGKSGGSGGGGGGGVSTSAAGTSGQGFAGGAGITQGASGAGGGGAAGAGASPTATGDNRVGGTGGAGVTSSITGTAQGVAGGGGGGATSFGSGTFTGGTASHGGGAGGAAAADQAGAGAAATTAGGGGGGSYGTAPGGAGFRGRFVIRVKR